METTADKLIEPGDVLNPRTVRGDRAAALDMKAKALSGAKTPEEDPNNAATMAAAGTAANATVADQLAVLQQRKEFNHLYHRKPSFAG